jgi:DNA uptake protein ComE-like DNA-binding protein
MSMLMSRTRSPQNVRVAARSRVFSARERKPSTAPEDWVPSGLQAGAPEASAAVRVVEQAEAVPTDPPAAAELGAEVQRLRRELDEARKRIETMKRAAAKAAAEANPGDHHDPAGTLDLNSATFEELRSVGLSVTQAARLIGQREQHGGFASVDDVDGIVGIPRDVKQALKDTGSV